MDKRLGLALAISMAILFAWWKIFPPQPPPAASPPVVAQAPAMSAGTAPAVPSAAPTPGQPDGVPAAAAAAPAPEELVALDSPDAHFVLSSWGGTLSEVKVKETKFRQRK